MAEKEDKYLQTHSWILMRLVQILGLLKDLQNRHTVQIIFDLEKIYIFSSNEYRQIHVNIGLIYLRLIIAND